jgi:hypothetical protein
MGGGGRRRARWRSTGEAGGRILERGSTGRKRVWRGREPREACALGGDVRAGGSGPLGSWTRDV